MTIATSSQVEALTTVNFSVNGQPVNVTTVADGALIAGAPGIAGPDGNQGGLRRR